MAKYYANYIAGMGIYNCFWRYLGNDANKFSPDLIKKIATLRDTAAKYYPLLEAALRKVQIKGDQKQIISGQQLACLTLHEMRSYIKSDQLPVIINTLKQRAAGFIFLLAADKKREIVLAGKNYASAVTKMFKQKNSTKIIKGQTGYPGLVRGVVYNLENKAVRKLPKKFILVAIATHPNNLAIVKKSSAIVADEGGILGHAAIVAREFKIPAVVGTKYASQIFQDGDLVEVDATKGIVRKI